MKNSTRKLIIAQGYSEQIVDSNEKIIALAKWTPLSCAILGLTGIILQSPIYLIVLGLLTFTGAFSSNSLYDYLYKYFFSYFINLGVMPKHGIQRRIGCCIGACLFLTGGMAFYMEVPLVAYIASLFIITFAFIAGFFNWCFVSAFYGIFVGKKQDCC